MLCSHIYIVFCMFSVDVVAVDCGSEHVVVVGGQVYSIINHFLKGQGHAIFQLPFVFAKPILAPDWHVTAFLNMASISQRYPNRKFEFVTQRRHWHRGEHFWRMQILSQNRNYKYMCTCYAEIIQHVTHTKNGGKKSRNTVSLTMNIIADRIYFVISNCVCTAGRHICLGEGGRRQAGPSRRGGCLHAKRKRFKNNNLPQMGVCLFILEGPRSYGFNFRHPASLRLKEKKEKMRHQKILTQFV